MHKLTCRYLPRLDGGLSAATLARLFPEPSVTASFIALLQESGVAGFDLASIVVLREDIPILFWPLFETRFDLSSFVEGWIKQVLKAAGRLVPSLLQPKILGIGLIEGEWSEIGIDPGIDENTLNAACRLALDAVQTLASEHGSDIVSFYNFNQFTRLPAEIVEQFNRVTFRPCAQVAIDFSSMDEYLGRLSRGARKDLRRKMRVSPEVRVVHCSIVAPYLDRVFQLYLDTVARSPIVLGAHNRLFFEKICELVPGSQFVLYFVRDELVAFNLLVVRQAALVDKYFCMESRLGSKFNLYVLSWYENVRTCVERKIPLYYTGQGTEKTKAHLGATFIPSFILFRHRFALLDRLLVWQHAMTGKLLSYLKFWPAVSPPVQVAKGQA